MKNLFILAMIVSLAVVSCKKENPDNTTTTTTTETTPTDAVERFGVISFQTNQTWKITKGKGNTISQEWSDAVTATKCDKTTFLGRNSDKVYLADCRSNPDYKGDLFSWEAVKKYKAVLCPSPWRVPTMQDFVNLDIALYNNGTVHPDDTKYRDNNWGGVYGGYCSMNGTLNGRGVSASYWSQSEFSSTHAYFLYFSSNDNVDPQDNDYKYYGRTLRCVK